MTVETFEPELQPKTQADYLRVLWKGFQKMDSDIIEIRKQTTETNGRVRLHDVILKVAGALAVGFMVGVGAINAAAALGLLPI